MASRRPGRSRGPCGQSTRCRWRALWARGRGGHEGRRLARRLGSVSEVGVLGEQLDILADGQAKVDDMARQKVGQAQLAEKRAREKVRHAETLAASAQKTLRQAAGYRCRADTKLRLQQDVHEADVELLQERLASTKAKVYQARALGADARVDVRAAAKGAREADQARVAAEVSACCASTCCHYPHLAASIRLCSNFF